MSSYVSNTHEYMGLAALTTAIVLLESLPIDTFCEIKLRSFHSVIMSQTPTKSLPVMSNWKVERSTAMKLVIKKLQPNIGE